MTTTTGDTGATGGAAAGSAGAGAGGSGSGTTSSTPPGPSYCETAMLPARAWSDGPYGAHRNEIADDFSVELVDGSTWSFKEQWDGCESYVFLPDTLHVSDLDKTSIWESDLFTLIKTSPKNAHYFFISAAGTDEGAKASTDAMAARIEQTLAPQSQELHDHWKARLHVVAQRAAAQPSWIKDMLAGIGELGFAIDPFQRVRGIGNLADIKRYDQALADAMAWPWKQNLAYAAYEVRHFNYEVDRQAQLDAESATVIPFWDGEVLAQLAEKDVTLPSEAEMAKFDTLEVDVSSMCPDPEKIEIGNCGAWDYIANLSVVDDGGNFVELARFITSYHRETRWIVDVSPMLVHLKKGGARHFKWEFAPSWNTQPTATKLSLRLSNKNKGYAPSEATFLYAGGPFNAMYNAANTPKDVPIPVDAKRVELVAIITGHGAETGQCSEFCNHQHEFKVNGNVHLKEHKEAGTETKCVDHVDSGMVPNQSGTWWYGRGGWCPGQQVDPWVVDVTAEVTPGQSATIEYQGLYMGSPPTDSSGNIDMVSYLVVYK